MVIISNIFIENSNQKILLKYGESGLSLPSINPIDAYTLKEHITVLLLGIGITDVVEDDIELYNVDDYIENNEHIITISYKVHTRINSITNKVNYKFVSLSDLKDNLSNISNEKERFLTRMYILNPYN